MPGKEVVQEVATNKLEMTYIGRRKETVAQRVALRQILEVCTGEKGYNGGGRRREA